MKYLTSKYKITAMASKTMAVKLFIRLLLLPKFLR